MHPVLSGCVSKNDEIFALASFLLVLKSPVVQLSMINRGSDSVLAFPLPVSPWLSRGQLIYYITFASTCQEVFKTFFKKSFEPAIREVFTRSLPQGLLIISHFLSLVKGVVKIFFGEVCVVKRYDPKGRKINKDMVAMCPEASERSRRRSGEASGRGGD